MKIVIGAERPNRMFDPLVAEFPEVEFVTPKRKDEERAAMRDADAYLGRIGAESFEAAGPSLRWVHSSGAGIETMAAIRDLVDSEVTVTNMRGAHGRCIAEHAFAMLLSLTRQLVPLMENQRQHKWEATRGAMRELTGNTMVVLGMGTIGSTIARRGAAFEMRVIGVDMQPVEPPPGVEAVWLNPKDFADRESFDLALVRELEKRQVGLVCQAGYMRILSAAFVKEGEDPPHVSIGTLSLYHGDKKVGEAKIRTQPGKFAIAGEGRLACNQVLYHLQERAIEHAFRFRDDLLQRQAVHVCGTQIDGAARDQLPNVVRARVDP